MYFICLFFFVSVSVTSVTCDCDSGKLPPEVYIYDLEDAKVHFKEFIKNFNKNYGAEYEYRFGVFKENLKKINLWNAEENFNVHGITQFSDMTEGEFLEYAGFFNPELTNLTDSDVVNIDTLRHGVNYPASLDYRNYNMVTPVKDQGGCSCCYIFSAVGHIEGQYAKKYGQLLSFSVKQVLDCMNVGGCVFGYPRHVMQSTADFGGLVLDGDYPYSPVQSACNVNKSRIVARVAGGNTLQAGENALIAYLNMYGPLPVAIRASDKMSQFRGGRVFRDPNCMQSQNHHVVLLIGYGTAPDGKEYWLIKNSWGTSWGEQGYFRMARGEGMCGIGQYGPAITTII